MFSRIPKNAPCGPAHSRTVFGLARNRFRRFRFDIDKTNKRSSKIREELRSCVEIRGEPLPKAQLNKNEKAHNERPLQQSRRPPPEKFAGDERECGEDERKQFRERKHVEGAGEPRK